MTKRLLTQTGRRVAIASYDPNQRLVSSTEQSARSVTPPYTHPPYKSNKPGSHRLISGTQMISTRIIA